MLHSMLPGKQQARSVFDFVDILEPRRHSSDLAWVSRPMALAKAFDRARSQSNPEILKYNALESEEMAAIIEEFSQDMNLTKEQIRLKVLDILNEIGYARSMPVVRFLALVLIKIIKRTLGALYVNEARLNQLRAQWGNSPVLFLPSHRSYGDFILMAYLCFNYNIEIPCVAAGMDFQSMYLMGNMMRDCTAFFMRRSYGQDKLYWRVFQVYVHHLVTGSVAPLEFFIEGTRSRTGKSLYPKLGLLSMCLDPVINSQVSDLIIIPVSISYERAMEENLFACELLGIPKPKESTSGFIKAVNTLKEQYGNIYIDFADPISVKQFLSSVDSGLHSNLTLCLGHEILRRQQQVSVISVFNVLSILLSHHHISHSHSIPLTQATKFLAWFSTILENMGALVDVPKGGLSIAVQDSVVIHSSLVSITRDKDSNEEVLCSNSTNMNFSNINSSKLKGHKLQEITMTSSVTWMSLQNYSNPCLSFLIDPALVSILLLSNSKDNLSREALLRQYIQLRLMFQYEFVFYPPLADELLTTAIYQLQELNIVNVTSAISLIQSDHSKYLCSIFVSLLYPYIFGYHIVYSVLLELETNQNGSSRHSDKLLVRVIQSRVEAALLSDSLRHPYPLSLDLISCCLSGLTQQKALTRIRTNNIVEYTIHREPLQVLWNDLSQVLHTLVKLIPNHDQNIPPVSSQVHQKSKL